MVAHEFIPNQPLSVCRGGVFITLITASYHPRLHTRRPSCAPCSCLLLLLSCCCYLYSYWNHFINLIIYMASCLFSLADCGIRCAVVPNGWLLRICSGLRITRLHLHMFRLIYNEVHLCTRKIYAIFMLILAVGLALTSHFSNATLKHHQQVFLVSGNLCCFRSMMVLRAPALCCFGSDVV